MPDMTNPAGRLHHWYSEAIGAEKNLRRQQARIHRERSLAQRVRDSMKAEPTIRLISAVDVWSEVWGIKRKGSTIPFAYLRQITILSELHSAVQRACTELPSGYHPDLLLKDFGAARAALEGSWPSEGGRPMRGSELRELLERSLPTLERIDHTLTERGFSDGVPLDRLAKLRAEVRDLREQVEADDLLDEDLRKLILARLRQILMAISKAHMSGDAGLREAAEALMGAVQLDPDLWERVSSSRWGPRIAGVWLGLMTTLGGVAAVPVLFPGYAANPPAIEAPAAPTTVDVQVEVDLEDPTIVDAEIVPDDRHDQAGTLDR